MRILYLIGNGFDINAGLDTSARGFVEKFFKHLEQREREATEHDRKLPDGVGIMLRSMRKDIDSWGDFEIALGALTEELDAADDPIGAFREAYYEFHDFFSTVIVGENERAKRADIDRGTAESFRRGCLNLFSDVMSTEEREKLRSAYKKGQWDFDFITFNYTCLLDRLVQAGTQVGLNNPFGNATTLIQPLHVHGQLSDDWGILIGVDNQSQIKGATCRGSESVSRLLVKPFSNNRMGMRRDEDAVSRIRSADMIAVYGMSLGQSDAKWWKEIADWICGSDDPDRLLLIAARNNELNPLRAWEGPDFKESVIRGFIERVEVTDPEQQARIMERILVPIGSKAFDVPVKLSDQDTVSDTTK